MIVVNSQKEQQASSFGRGTERMGAGGSGGQRSFPPSGYDMHGMRPVGGMHPAMGYGPAPTGEYSTSVFT